MNKPEYKSLFNNSCYLKTSFLRGCQAWKLAFNIIKIKISPSFQMIYGDFNEI